MKVPTRFSQFIFASIWLFALTVYFFIWDVAPELMIFSQQNVVIITVAGLLGFILTWVLFNKKRGARHE